MKKIRLARRFFSTLAQVVDGKGNKATFFLLMDRFVRKAGIHISERVTNPIAGSQRFYRLMHP
jgi:hypothetical protein